MTKLDFLICARDQQQGQAVAEILKKADYRADLVKEATAAVDRLLSRGYGALILEAEVEADAEMGITRAVSILKKINSALPIIVMSREQSLEREREIRALEIFYYLVEPVDEEELLRVAKDALRKQSL